MVSLCTGEPNTLMFKRAMKKEILKLTPNSIICKKASSFTLIKEDESKEDCDLKPKPTVTRDELCILFQAVAFFYNILMRMP